MLWFWDNEVKKAVIVWRVNAVDRQTMNTKFWWEKFSGNTWKTEKMIKDNITMGLLRRVCENQN